MACEQKGQIPCIELSYSVVLRFHRNQKTLVLNMVKHTGWEKSGILNQCLEETHRKHLSGDAQSKK